MTRNRVVQMIIVSLLMVSLLVGCQGRIEGFRKAKWGDTADAIIASEKETGLEVYSSDINYMNYFVIEYSDVVVDGKTADIEYNLTNYIDLNEAINFPFKFRNYHKKNPEEISELKNKDAMRLDDIRLISSVYRFRNLNKNAYLSLVAAMEEKYGKPYHQDDLALASSENYLYTRWSDSLVDISIQCSSDFSEANIYYDATYDALKQFELSNGSSDL